MDVVAAGPATRALKQSHREKYPTVRAMYVMGVSTFASTVGSAYFNLYGNNRLASETQFIPHRARNNGSTSYHVFTVAMLSGD